MGMKNKFDVALMDFEISFMRLYFIVSEKCYIENYHTLLMMGAKSFFCSFSFFFNFLGFKCKFTCLGSETVLLLYVFLFPLLFFF